MLESQLERLSEISCTPTASKGLVSTGKGGVRGAFGEREREGGGVVCARCLSDERM